MKFKMLFPKMIVILVATMLLAILSIVSYPSPESSHAISPTQNDIQKTDLNILSQIEDQSIANCRYGVTAAPRDVELISRVGAGVFYRWKPDWPGPLPENDAELMHMIRPRQKKTSTGEYLPEYYTNVPLDEELAEVIRNDSGAVWMIGNEPERGPNPGEVWSPRTDDIHADIYVEAYHDIYHFIKSVDPTARIANAGLIQITPMRLQYLDMMWKAYERKYGVTMPVDVWTIHTYVLPELTVTGEPNNIASAALGTDLDLGKRGSGGDITKCANSDVYCFAEHDDELLLEEQVVAMRQWMKERGQQDKPLVVTEYGTLYHYFIKEDGTCRMRDENGECFTPERVSSFMLDTFDYFNNARDANLGLTTDDDKLVQQWIWYGAWNWDIASADLLLNDLQTLSLMGETYRDHVFAEPAYVNLLVDDVAGRVVSQDPDGTSTALLSLDFRNNGNTAVTNPFTVTFYRDAALSQQIDSITIAAGVRGCATRAYSAELEWEGLSVGNHQFWAKVDSGNVINEPDKTDNTGMGQFSIGEAVYALEVQIVSDGEGVGGTVSVTPEGPTYPEETIVSLTAVPYSGWTFTGWQGAIVGAVPQVTATMYDNLSVEAHFKQDHYELIVDILGDGEVTISPDQDFYLFGESTTLRASPSSGWRFVKWRGDLETSNPIIEHSFTGDIYAKAVFEEAPNTAFYPVVITK